MTMLLHAVLQESHEAAEGLPGPFALEPGLIIWTWVVFIALFLLLRKFAWPPILRLTEEREKRISRQLEEAARLNAEAKAALEEHQRLIGDARGEAQTLLNDAKTVAQKERDHLLAKTRSEQEQMLDRAKREIDAERDRALADLRREAVDLSLAAASKLIQQRLESDVDRKIVEDYLGSLEGQR